MSAPMLETERLVLSGQTVDDFHESVQLWADPNVTRFIGGRPFREDESWIRLIRNAGHWAMLGFGMWVIRERETGTYVGEIGFHDMHRQIEPRFDGVPEAGWVLSPTAHGKGFASEALQAVLAWSDGYLAAPRTVCIISPDNAPSLRVAAKAGYTELAQTIYNESPTVILERFKPL